jgi:ATP-binding cassette subfamily C (CFTR/MRP) protein 1
MFDDKLILLPKSRKEHSGTGSSSGVSTPFISGTQTPRTDDDDATLALSLRDGSPEVEDMEKLSRKMSFGKATLAEAPSVRASTSGSTAEHSEHGQVKRDVYLQYLEAASGVGFAAFLVATLLQQVMSVLANITLRNWGEHNLEAGDNSGMFNYLLGYGLFSLSCTILGGVAAVLLWVLCSVRSARHLHDSVSRI